MMGAPLGMLRSPLVAGVDDANVFGSNTTPPISGGMPVDPFVYGAGGAQMSPDEVARRHEQAAQLMAAGVDTSPVGHWTQGLARVGQALAGNVIEGRAQKADTANEAARASIIANLTGATPASNAVAAGLLSGDAMTQKLALQADERLHPKAVAPHYWETNDGSLGMIGADGQPQIAYQDPTPKVTWTQVDLPNGQKQLIPSINGQIMGGGGPTSSAPAGGAQPPATLPPDFDFSQGGAATQAPSPFPIR